MLLRAPGCSRDQERRRSSRCATCSGTGKILAPAWWIASVARVTSGCGAVVSKYVNYFHPVKYPLLVTLAAVVLIALAVRYSLRVSETSPPSQPAVTSDTSSHRNGPRDIPRASCPEKPTTPEPLPQDRTVDTLAAEFTKLFEKGEFVLGTCVAEAGLDETGAVVSVRVIRPGPLDRRVKSAMVRRIETRKFRPALACGRPVPSTITLAFTHCPTPPPETR